MRLRRLWLIFPVLLMAVSMQASPVSRNNPDFSMLNGAPIVVPAHSLPEPAALALFGSSLIAIAASIRRRAGRASEPLVKL